MTICTIIDALDDPALLGASFPAETRDAWRAVLAAAFAVPLTETQRDIFASLSGGRDLPLQRVRNLGVVAGRRADKTHAAVGVAGYIATILVEQEGILKRLAPGEAGVVQFYAVDREQARVALKYLRGMLEASPILGPMVVRENANGVTLVNGVAIEVMTNNYRTARGRTVLAAIMDECAFYDGEGAACSDLELHRALQPALSTTRGMLIMISSPHGKSGLLWNLYRKYFGKNDPQTLIVQGGTIDFNPTFDQKDIDDALEDDPEGARAEYLGQFRSDVAAFLAREVIDQAMRTEPLELPYDRKHRYFAFTDPSGGGQDEFCLGIGHREDKSLIVDAVRARRGTPAEIVAEYAGALKEYRITAVSGDRYAGSWPADEFKRHNITYKPADKAKSGLYLDLLPALNSGRVELPPDDRLIHQLAGLERRTARGGRDSIDHTPGAHDDRANVVAGLVSCTLNQSGYPTGADGMRRMLYGPNGEDENKPLRPAYPWPGGFGRGYY